MPQKATLTKYFPSEKTRYVEGDDLGINLTMAKALGGSGDKGRTNPEELFAAGYGACFQSSMNAVAPSVILSLESEAKQQGQPYARTGQSDRAGLDSIEGGSNSSKSGSNPAGKATTGDGNSKKGRTYPKMPGDPEDSIVDTTVHLVGDMEKLDMGIRVDMKVGVRGLPREATEKIVKKALQVCPYSRAIRGNVTTNVEVVEL
jgi:organic hydroperoxide reductase OsmC/OhrA